MGIAAWAVNKTIAVLDRLPPEAVTRKVTSSFPSLFATMQHIYFADSYYLTYLKGGSISFGDVQVPQTYEELKEQLPQLQTAALSWARDNIDPTGTRDG